MPIKIDQTVELASVIGIAVVGLDGFHKFLPSVAEVRAAKPGDREVRANVHAGELIAGVSVLTVSMLASSVAGNGLPLVVGGMSFLAMFAVYEWLLRTPQPFNG